MHLHDAILLSGLCSLIAGGVPRAPAVRAALLKHVGAMP